MSLTEAELKEKLRQAGCDPNAPGWIRSEPRDLSQLPVFVRQRELLRELARALRAQLHGDQTQLDEAKEALARMRHGGGQ